MKKVSIVLLLVALGIVGNSSGEPVKVSVFYETLCPDSIRFIVRQFQPTFQALGGFGNPYLDIDFVPYGKATTQQNPDGSYTFRCQHGKAECNGNRMHACALAHLPTKSLADFIVCSMGSIYPPTSGPKCASKLGLDWHPVESCIKNEGDKLLAEMGNRTHSLDPKLYFVPWILYNGVFTEEDLQQSQRDFLGVLCKKLSGTELPSACTKAIEEELKLR